MDKTYASLNSMSNKKCSKSNIFTTAYEAALKKSGLKQAKIAEMTRIQATRIGQYANGDMEPGLENLGKIARAFGLTVAQFFAHEEPKSLPVIKPPPLRAVPEGELESDYHQVPFRDDMRLAAGEGEAPEDFYEVDSSPVVIHKSDLRRYRTANLVAFRVGGRSMEPTIMKNGVIVVDLADKEWERLKSLGIYMLRLDGAPAVKRLKWAKKNEVLVVISDNPAEDTIYRDVEEVELFGRVIWIWGEH